MAVHQHRRARDVPVVDVPCARPAMLPLRTTFVTLHRMTAHVVTIRLASALRSRSSIPVRRQRSKRSSTRLSGSDSVARRRRVSSASAPRRHDDEQGRAHAGQVVQRASARPRCASTIAASARVRARTTRATAKRTMRWRCSTGPAQRWPDAQLWLGGFSFGGAVAIRAAVRARRRAPGHRRAGDPARRRVDTTRLPTCPWLLVQGDRMNWSTPPTSNAGRQALRVAAATRDAAGRRSFLSRPAERLRDVVVDWLGRRSDGSERGMQADAMLGQLKKIFGTEPAVAGMLEDREPLRAGDCGAADRAGALGFFRIRRRSRRDPSPAAEALRPRRTRRSIH